MEKGRCKGFYYYDSVWGEAWLLNPKKASEFQVAEGIALGRHSPIDSVLDEDFWYTLFLGTVHSVFLGSLQIDVTSYSKRKFSNGITFETTTNTTTGTVLSDLIAVYNDGTYLRFQGEVQYGLSG